MNKGALLRKTSGTTWYQRV